MATKITLLISLLMYAVVVSQSFMYLLALKNMQLSLGYGSYIEVRKLIDGSMRTNFRYIVYGALLTSLFLVILTAKQPASLLFITSSIAFVALVIDTLITVKGNMPLNVIISQWQPGSAPANWTDIRLQWMNYLQYRQVANITGFLALAAGLVFRK